MIKATAGNYLLLGIDEENIRRLREKQPIKVEGKALGCNKDIIIFAGKDPRDLIKDLKGWGLALPDVMHVGKVYTEKGETDETHPDH